MPIKELGVKMFAPCAMCINLPYEGFINMELALSPTSLNLVTHSLETISDVVGFMQRIASQCIQGFRIMCNNFKILFKDSLKNLDNGWSKSIFLENKVAVNFNFRNGAKKSGQSGHS